MVVEAGGKPVMCALPASYKIDMKELARQLGVDAGEVELADEAKLGEWFPDCELGAEPPIVGCSPERAAVAMIAATTS